MDIRDQWSIALVPCAEMFGGAERMEKVMKRKPDVPFSSIAKADPETHCIIANNGDKIAKVGKSFCILKALVLV